MPQLIACEVSAIFTVWLNFEWLAGMLRKQKKAEEEAQKLEAEKKEAQASRDEYGK